MPTRGLRTVDHAILIINLGSGPKHLTQPLGR